MKRFHFLQLGLMQIILLGMCLSWMPTPLHGQSYQWENFAGSNGGTGDRNAAGSAARFYLPNGTVRAPDGNFFVADYSNFTVRRVTPGGVVTTLAGRAGVMAHANGPLADARFVGPNGLAVDGLGNLYLSDSVTVRKIDLALGSVQPLAGQPNIPGHVDGPAAGVALLFAPAGLAVKADGTVVYMADYGMHTIRRITVATGIVQTIAGGAGLPGSANGFGAAARFFNPTGIALSADENTLFVSDSSNHAIRAVTLDEMNFPVTTLAGMPGSSGMDDGIGPAARFWMPTALALDPTGNALAVVDAGNVLVRVVLLANLQVTTLMGTPLTNGSRDASAADLAFGIKASFSFNTATAGTNGAAYEADGNLIIADSFNHTLRRVSATGSVTTLAGRATEADFAHGSGGGARFSHPAGLALEENAIGRLIVADSWNHVIRGIAPAGSVGLLSGSVGQVGISAAEHNYPGAVAVDGVGRILVADTGNSRIVRLLSNGTPDVLFNGMGGGGPGGLPGSAFIGTPGLVSNMDGPLPGASFAYPEGVAEDPANGMIYLADTGNHTIRKIDLTTGTVSTIGGAPGSPDRTDGPGAVSRFNSPTALVVDGAGVIYVSDTVNNLIRRMTPAAGGDFVVDTVAGTGNTFYSDGVGNTAAFYLPRGIAHDGAGNLYVADSYNQLVRKIAIGPGNTSVVTTLGGRPASVGNQGGLGSEAMFYQPHGIAVKPDGTVFLSTVYSHGIFIGSPPVTVPPVLTQPGDFQLTRSPVAVAFTLPEEAMPGSVRLGFGPHVLTLSSGLEPAGAHAFSFNPANPLASPEIAAGPSIADGTYTVTLTYADTAGAPPASDMASNVTIDTTPPETTLTNAPATATPSALAPFAFASNEAGVVFRGRLDSNPFALLSSPHHYIVSAGGHTFEVFAVDGAGNEDATPATHAWTVSPTAIGIWRDLRFGLNALDSAIAGNLADPDGDGVPNLQEYASGTDPLSAFSMPGQEWKREGSAITMIHERSITATDATFGIEKSEEIGGWTNAVFTEEELSSNGITRRVKVTVPLGSNQLTGPRGFLRAKVVVAP